MTSIWLEHGFRALLDELVNEDPDWLAVQLESIRRVRTDEKFQRLVEEHERRVAEGRPDRLEQLRSQGVRDDVAIESIAIFLSCIANGLALRHTMADPLPDLDEIAELVERGVGPRAEPSRRTAPRRTPRTASRRS
jgi:hypothetical protein